MVYQCSIQARDFCDQQRLAKPSSGLGHRQNITLMMTSWNGDISELLAICSGNSPVPGEFRAQRPVTRSFDVFFDLRLNKRLSKQPWGWWFETPLRQLWRHRNAQVKHLMQSVTSGSTSTVEELNQRWIKAWRSDYTQTERMDVIIYACIHINETMFVTGAQISAQSCVVFLYNFLTENFKTWMCSFGVNWKNKHLRVN